MAATFSFSIRDEASPTLQALIGDVRNATLAAKAGARGVAVKLRDHFAELESERPNKWGYPRQHFWSQVRGSVSDVTTSGNSASVTIAHVAFRQKLEGGTIRPTPGHKYLTIPAHPDAYGKRAREFANLQFVIVADPSSGRMRPALIAPRAVSTLISLGRKKFKAIGNEVGMLPLFWLVREVKQAPTPGALPTDAALQQAAMDGAEGWAADITARNAKV